MKFRVPEKIGQAIFALVVITNLVGIILNNYWRWSL